MVRDVRMRQGLMVRAAAVVLAFATLPASAQLSPFRSTRYWPTLSPEDDRMLFDSIDRLNSAGPLRVGQSES